ncbi:hypothetical protein CLV78_102445 [Aliiruegeria haliotis]|uniref:Uncharacterized protein n=1 Tax=Aliiruegeria haliotis TaxID=1280846 RepID=A0A2T0RVU3_9RHOB|nr:hypothetical protein [Aliiruegeria haliotis]PRY25268.1 hypothetical protein CLV78_102445 [Aliiruegeria haliotis]
MRNICLALLATVILTGCTTFPELDAAVSEAGQAAPQPTLVDNRPLLAQAEALTIDDTTREGLQGRATALQASAAGQPAYVISPEERAELEATHLRLRNTVSSVAPDT